MPSEHNHPEELFDFGIRDRIEKKVIEALPAIIKLIVSDYETLHEFDNHRLVIPPLGVEEILTIWSHIRKRDTSWVDDII